LDGGRDGGGREYPSRPLVGIGIIVLKPAEVLLVRRSRPPAAGEWSLPGGLQKLGETAEEAARRELKEETGLAVGPLMLAGFFDSIHAEPDGRIRFHYTILDFAARFVSGEPRAGSDVAELAWAGEAEFRRFALHREARAMIAQARLLLG